MPVYNGERYLRGALDGILAQSYADFEVVITDNASTDGTAEIGRAYAARDPRIRYHRGEANVGAARNFNRAFELARGVYFKWAAHDDLVEPGYLEACVTALEADPGAVLCQAGVKHIDATGAFTGNEERTLRRVSDPDPVVRFRELVLVHHGCFAIFGIFRSETLRQTPLIGGYLSSDRILLAELGLRGRFLLLPEYLFCSRNHPERSIRSLQTRERAVWFDVDNANRILLPKWRRLQEYQRAVARVALTPRQRRACWFTLARWSARNATGLAANLVQAAGQWAGLR
jgi:glycosyltransferase involved in cell wall biosynthesis